MQLTLIILLVGAAVVPATNGAKILMLTLTNTSHFLEIDGVGKPLLARGHDVYVLFDDNLKLPKGANYKLVTFHNPMENTFFDKKNQQKFLEKSDSGMNMTMVFELIKNSCKNMMSDAELIPKLKSLKFDLAIVDNGPAPCLYLIPYALGIPYVTVSSVLFSWYARVPILPSITVPSVGLEMFGLHFCEETPNQLSFVKRLCRLIAITVVESFFTFVEDDYLRQYIDFPSLTAIRENVSLTLVNSGHLLSPPLPKLPNVEYVGGLTTRPAKPLEDSLDTWMSAAPNVVVVSFGSLLTNLPAPLARKLFDAFRRLTKYRFLMRFSSQDSKAYDVADNVRVMDWLPQNDALGHRSTRAFITHSGNNGQQEALYHGVPMMCFYVQADQKTNAKRVRDRGYGKMLSIHDFTSDQLVDYVTDLIENRTYSTRIKLASAVFHSDKHPSERAADAVEHVLKYGAEHLRPTEAYRLSFWQFYMLDVLGVLYAMALGVAVLVYKLAKCVLKRAFGRNTDETKAKAKAKAD